MGLLVDYMSGRQIVGHHAPGSTGACYVAQAVEHFSERVHSLWGFFGHQRQVGSDECPLIVAHFAGV